MAQIQSTTPFPRQQPTQAQMLQRRSTMHMQSVNNLWQQMQQAFSTIGQFCWNPPQGYTVQQMFDLFGTSAGSLFQLSNAYMQMMQTVTGTAPPSPVPVGWKYTINKDGTVTVTPPASPSRAKSSNK